MLRASYYYNFTVLVYYIYSHYNKYSYGGFRYKSSLYNHRMHLLSLISCYCTLIYNNDVVLLCFICNHHKTLLISQIIITKLCLYHKFKINSSLTFSKAIFTADNLINHLLISPITQKQQKFKGSHTENILKYRALSGVR